MPARPVEAGGGRLAAIVSVLRGSWGRIALLFVGLALPLWLFAELADEVHEMEALVFDDALLLRLNAMATPAWDAFFLAVTRVGYQYGVIPGDIIVALALFALRRWREAVFASLSFAGSALLNMATKQVFQRERPSLWESIAPESTFSFPSGHAMGSITLAAVLVLLAWPTRWRWPVLVAATVFTVLVGVSRIYLGVHYPSDILGGWAAGLAWVVGLYLVLFRQRLPWQRHRGNATA
ncbi:phosphatase PAP2 family protein [Xanthomonas sp. XNM01]|uniref:phosphatase PAP2 family protein n=1 Tax=Xanthomonas sp. XNM01 TaxID=2769289 RepID=UPI00177F554F|nr:phosphatase PAP2 family protein [Xanthomonas sp. XNM01]MBD9368092.1 phosphatase PAP2 family protein [Xanthomonas sp. XNM01]